MFISFHFCYDSIKTLFFHNRNKKEKEVKFHNRLTILLKSVNDFIIEFLLQFFIVVSFTYLLKTLFLKQVKRKCSNENSINLHHTTLKFKFVYSSSIYHTNMFTFSFWNCLQICLESKHKLLY